MERLIRSTLLTLISVLFFCFTTSTSAQTWTKYHCQGGNIEDGYVTPDNTNELILFSYHYMEKSMLRSDDGGDSLVLDENYPEFQLGKLAECKSRPDSLYVYGRAGDHRKLLFSPDHGQTFEDRTPTEFTIDGYRLSTSWSNPDLICLISDENLIISSDAGENWTQYDSIPENTEAFFFHPLQDSTWYIMSFNYGYADGLFISRDFGVTWAEHDSIPEYSDDFLLGRNLVIDVQNPDIMYCNAMDGWEFYACGIAKSTDGGEHWELMENPIDIIDFDYDGSMLILDGNHLYSSYDSGETLVSRLAEGASLPQEGYDPFRDPTMVLTYMGSQDTLWVCRSDILFRTANRGLTWEIIGEGFDSQAFEIIQLNPHDDNQLLLFGPDANSWTLNKDGSGLQLTSMSRVDGFQISSVSPDTMLRYSMGVLRDNQKRLELSTDGGTSWENLDSLLPLETEDMGLVEAAMLNSNPDILFVEVGEFWGYDYYEPIIYRSEDRGETWSVVEHVDNIARFVPDTYNPDRMYITCDGSATRWDASDGSRTSIHPLLKYINEIHPLTGDIRGATDEGTVVVSEDGETLTSITMPGESYISNLDFHQGNPQGLVVTNYDEELYYTPDLGITWVSYDVPEDCDFQVGSGLVVDSEGTIFALDSRTGLWVGEGVILGINEEPEQLTPLTFELYSPYPNPFNSTVQIPFNMARQGRVQFTVYDMLGREVTRIVRTVETAGKQTISWNTSGKNIASGTYILQMEADTFKSSKKIQLIK